MTEDVELPEGDVPPPIRVAETVIAAYQWEIWKGTITRTSRKALVVATLVAVVVAGGLGALGYDLVDGAARLSAFVYTPAIAAGMWFWVRKTLTRRWMTPVLDELRPRVVPALVSRISDLQLIGLADHGGALLVEESTVITSDRRDAAMVLIASEYDMSLYPNIFYGGGSGGGG